MKTRKRFYIVGVGCPTLRRRRHYKILSTRPGRAWYIALREFFDEFPGAVTRGLTVGGDTLIFSKWARMHRAAVAARAS